MKHELTIVIFSILIVLGAAFLFFNTQGNPGLTGFAIENPELLQTETSPTKTQEAQEQITEQEAQEAINRAETIVDEMANAGFSITRVKDTLIEANRVFEQVKNAEILRSDSSTNFHKQRAREALRLIDWEELTFNSVLIHTEEIKRLREKAFLLSDTIGANKIALSPSKEPQDPKTLDLLNKIDNEFEKEKYEEVDKLLIDLRNLAESKRSENTLLKTAQRNAQSFIQRNWYFILGFLITIAIIGLITQRKVSRKLLQNKIKKTKTEEKVLLDLTKKAQTERFKENKISALVYDIRIKKYKTRLSEIKETLPVLEANLRKTKAPKPPKKRPHKPKKAKPKHLKRKLKSK